MPRHFLAGKDRSTPLQRERMFNIPPVILALFLLCCFAYILPTYLLSAGKSEAFTAYFGFVPVVFLHNHDVMTQISAVSYSFLHGSFIHLGLNMLWFVIFGTPLANRLGSAFFILFWIFGAVIAALAFCLIHFDSEAQLIGASGAISAMMGAAGRYNFEARGGAFLPEALLPIKEALRSRAVLVTLGSFIALNALTAADQTALGFVNDGTSIAWEAHIGGLLAGFLSIGLFEKWAHNFKP